MKQAAETKSEMLLGLVAYDSHTHRYTPAVCLLWANKTSDLWKSNLTFTHGGRFYFWPNPSRTKKDAPSILSNGWNAFFSARSSSGEVQLKYEPMCRLIDINDRWKSLITNPGKPFGDANRWLQRWLALCDPSKPRVLTPLLSPLPGIDIAMQTCLCQLNLFSNFPQGESVPLTPCPCLPSRSLQLCFCFLYLRPVLLSFISPFPTWVGLRHMC